ncbi:hypothetical protein L596_025108 [Steinernema carpocapsae]|uniref:Uncharacterized protein n=1 Tax=Steinernema carpocapsae TaxID=34508 RepID=A0A4U5M6U4_STECR|nr:hypothetical protein L596_025108 [Steinernema carpocapsae]
MTTLSLQFNLTYLRVITASPQNCLVQICVRREQDVLFVSLEDFLQLTGNLAKANENHKMMTHLKDCEYFDFECVIGLENDLSNYIDEVHRARAPFQKPVEDL